MKFKLVLIAVAVAFLLWVLAAVGMAQGEPPPPYVGLKNPFLWSDTSAQEVGKGLYQRSCLGCHGADGSSIATVDLSTPDFPQRLEKRPDFYFWLLSEGRMDRGMPPFKSSLSDEQRWQVLTYLWSLGKEAPPQGVPPTTKPPAEGEGVILLLTALKQAQPGRVLTLTAVLQDSQGKPINNDVVKFFIKVDFFTSGLMEIGEAVTNDQGVAVLEYTPRLTGDIQIVAHHGKLYAPSGEGYETAVTLTITETDDPFYQPEAGIQLPAPGEEVFIGPESALELGEMGEAPTSAFRLPGGILSWLLLIVATVMLIWVTYFRVMYQVFRIPIRREIGDTDTRRVPLVGLAIIVAFGILLVLMLVTGPYSHFHLLE